MRSLIKANNITPTGAVHTQGQPLFCIRSSAGVTIKGIEEKEDWSMTAKNKKWTGDEDRILSDSMEEGISRGWSKQACYEDAAQKLARSATACRARYASLLKHKEDPSVRQDELEDSPPGDLLNLQDGIAFLHKLQSLFPLIIEQKELQQEAAELSKRNKLLKEQLEDQNRKLQIHLQKYEEMFGILKEAGIMAEEAGIREKVLH
jgi:RsfA family transcription factor